MSSETVCRKIWQLERRVVLAREQISLVKHPLSEEGPCRRIGELNQTPPQTNSLNLLSTNRPIEELQPVGLSRGRPVCLQADPGETPCCRVVAGVGRSRLCGEREGLRPKRRRNGRNPALISRAL